MGLHHSHAAIGAAVALMCAPAWSQTTQCVSVSTAGTSVSDNQSSFACLSADGRFVGFTSDSKQLVLRDSNGRPDTFVRDLDLAVTERVSLSDWDAQSLGGEAVSLSADGRFVAFASYASNLVQGDTNGSSDVFVRDRALAKTRRASVDSSGIQGNASSSLMIAPAISGDGRFVAFSSFASNLVSGDTNNFSDIFVRDLQLGTTERVSVDSSGNQGNDQSGYFVRPSISADGRFVAFESNASNLVPGDTNATLDVFVRDRTSGTTVRASVDSLGAQANDYSDTTAISADGRWVAFNSRASNLVAGDTNATSDIFVHDLVSGVTERVSVNSAGIEGNTQCDAWPAISGDGRFVAFGSWATNLVAGDSNNSPDIFVRDRVLGLTERVSVDSSGAQANSYSSSPTISADGMRVAFQSHASNLVAGDTNGYIDIFVRDRAPCAPGLANYCTAKVNSLGCTPAIWSSGTPSATAGSGFTIGATQVLEQESGILLYSVHGSGGLPFQGGFLCATGPTRRTPVQTSTPTGQLPCVGQYNLDFNAHIASGADPALVRGQQVWTQYWMRDANAASGTGLTNGLTFVICQ